jgi:cytochrome c oxidase subunit IV
MSVRERIFSGNVMLSIFLVLWALVLMLATASYATDTGQVVSEYSLTK